MDFKHESNRIFLTNSVGDTFAEILFPNVSEDTVDLCRTYVDPSLRGQNVADNLMQQAVSQIKESGKKVTPTCSYAIKWFEKHQEHHNILT